MFRCSLQFFFPNLMADNSYLKFRVVLFFPHILKDTVALLCVSFCEILNASRSLVVEEMRENNGKVFILAQTKMTSVLAGY